MIFSRLFSSLFLRFFTALLMVSLIPISINLLQLWQAQTTIKDKVEQELIANAKLIATEVNHWIDLNVRSSNLIAKTEQIQSMDSDSQVPILKATDSTFDWSYVAFTTDMEGDSIARSDGKPLKAYGDREYVKAIIAGEVVGHQVLISHVNGKPALCLSVPISKEQKLMGTLVQCSKLVNISKSIAAIKIGNTGLARLIDSKKRLIAHGDPEKLTENLKDLSKDPIVLLGKSDTPVISTINGKKIVSYTLATRLNWQLSVIQDYDDAYALLNTIKINAVIAGVLVLLSIFLIAYLLGNSIAKPIKKLADVASTFSKGEILQNIPSNTRHDEIGELARAIERLGEGMRVIVNRYQKLRKKKAGN